MTGTIYSEKKKKDRESCICGWPGISAEGKPEGS